MNSMNIVEMGQLTDLIIRSLESLPPVVTIPSDRQPLKLKEVQLENEIAQDITKITEYWRFVNENNNKFIIALIGMVNAGKSAVGNIILKKKESEVFMEGPIRETDEPKISYLDANTLLIDLPGLGSVSANEDDNIVRSYINRANLLLIVIGIDSPISKHLYEFFQSSLLKRGIEQQIIVILNKIDIWDGMPEIHREKELSRYIDFLMKGNPKLGFEGIQVLFDYEIPVIPLSVRHMRTGNTNSYEFVLYNAIDTAKSASSLGWYLRAVQEIYGYYCKYLFLLEGCYHLTEILQKALKNREWITGNVLDILNKEFDLLIYNVNEMDKACWGEMMHIPSPSFLEKTFETSGFQYKKDRLRVIREEYKEKMIDFFDGFVRNLFQEIDRIVRISFDWCPAISIPDSKAIHEVLGEIAWLNWDVHDDRYFRDVYITNENVNKRTKEKFDKLIEVLRIWLTQLSLEDVIRKAFLSKYETYLNASEAIEEFASNWIQVGDYFSELQNVEAERG